jgi:hypothetical protein
MASPGAPSPELQAWSETVERVLTILGGAHSVVTLLTTIPDAGTPDERAAVLWRLWQSFGFAVGSDKPTEQAEAIAAARLKEVPATLLPPTAAAISASLVQALAAGARAVPLFASSSVPWQLLANKSPQTVAVLYSQLPAGHVLREVLKESDGWVSDDLYTGGQRWVILGPALLLTVRLGGQHEFGAQPFYTVADVVNMTRSWRLPQQLEEEDRARREKGRQDMLAASKSIEERVAEQMAALEKRLRAEMANHNSTAAAKG